jgi:hypothetical protein
MLHQHMSLSWRWILMGAFGWHNLIIRLHFFMTSRMPWHSGYWVKWHERGHRILNAVQTLYSVLGLKTASQVSENNW